MTQGEIRSRCLGLSVIVYTAFSTLVTDKAVSVWPPAHNDPKVLVFTTLLVKTVSLGLILATFLYVGERIWARSILGTWAYKSSKGNFGVARIRFINDSLKYSVQLFDSAEQVLTALTKKKPVDPFAVVTSELCQYDSATGKFQTDYHIESTKPEYKSRKGLLVLTPTGPGQMKGQWYSTVDGFETKSGDLEFSASEAVQASIWKINTISHTVCRKSQALLSTYLGKITEAQLTSMLRYRHQEQAARTKV